MGPEEVYILMIYKNITKLEQSLYLSNPPGPSREYCTILKIGSNQSVQPVEPLTEPFTGSSQLLDRACY